MEKSNKNTENNVKEPTKTPSEKKGDRAAEKIAKKVRRIQQELTNIRVDKYDLYYNKLELNQKTMLNSEKKRRTTREKMLENELAKANEQLTLKNQLKQNENC